MAVLYHDPQNTVSTTPSKVDLWYSKLHKFHWLVPIFPKDVDHSGKWWYKLGYSAVWISSLWFYVLGLYFVYLAVINQFDFFYLLWTLNWMLIGLFLPVGLYRLVIYYLDRQKLIY